jgi:hypothetical protein
MANLEKQKQKGFWLEAIELLLDLFCLPFKLVWLLLKGIGWLFKGLGHATIFLFEVFFEFLGEILEAIFSGW